MLLAGSGPPLPRATRTGVQLKEITVNPLLSSLLFLFPCPLSRPRVRPPPASRPANTLFPTPPSALPHGRLQQPEKQEVKGKSETHPFKTQMVSSLDNTLYQPRKTTGVGGEGEDRLRILTAKGRGKKKKNTLEGTSVIHGPHRDFWV